MRVMISTSDKQKKLPADLKKIGDQFILQLHKQLEVSVEEIENAVTLLGKNRKAIEKFIERKIVHELQWKSFAWVKQWKAV